MSNVNIKRAVENIRSGTTVYTPLVEMIVNAIQAIDASQQANGVVKIEVIRSNQPDLVDSLGAVESFKVSDNGIGFTASNRDSFDTLYSDWKASEGGKGFGRFTCLKYFDDVRVESYYAENDQMFRRTFAMGKGNEIIIDEENISVETCPTGSTVHLSGVKAGRFTDKKLDTIAKYLVEKLLPYFVAKDYTCPQIIMFDSDKRTNVVLNDYITSAEHESIKEIDLADNQISFDFDEARISFEVRIFKFYAPRNLRSKMSLVAHRREVTDVTIQTYIPEFSEEFYEKIQNGDETVDRNYIIKVYVFGQYLDDNVSFERGGFNFQKDNDAIFGVSQSDIEKAAAEIARKAIGHEITVRQEKKRERVTGYVENSAPWHRTIAADIDLSGLAMSASNEDIELHLQKAKFEKECQTRKDVVQILAEASIDEVADRVAEILATISESSQNDLIHYVSMRKCILDIFGKSLETDTNGKYKSEGNVHDIIFQRRKDSEELNYEDHNLWILDERLNFTKYVSSDKTLNGGNTGRTDLTVFDKRMMFRGDNQTSNPVTIFEFKKPQRDDFANPSSGEDPVAQVIRYVNDIRDGKYKTPVGRAINVAENTPFYGYVVCDLTPKVKEWLHREKNFTEMPDQLGWFQWFPNNKLYLEVLSWEKIYNDAVMRNQIFFQKLGI